MILSGWPGWTVFAMAGVWVLPFCIRDLAKHPLLRFWDSHLSYAVLIGVPLLAMLTLNALDLRTRFFRRSPGPLRVVALCGAYALTMLVSLALVLGLDSARMLHYYGGDAGGSVGLLIVPSVLAYGVVGAVVSAVWLIVGRARRWVLARRR